MFFYVCTSLYGYMYSYEILRLCYLNLKNVHVHTLLYDHIFTSQVLATVKQALCMALMHPMLMHTFKTSLLQWNEANQTIRLHNLCSLQVDIHITFSALYPLHQMQGLF